MPRLTFLLDAGLDPQAYAAKHAAGLVPDRLAYGIENAPQGWSFEVADVPTPPRLRHLSEVLAGRLGFDVVHAFLNRRALRNAEAIYCHTEVEYLAAALVLGGGRRRRGPLLVGQTIWLFRRFDDLSWARRMLYGHLLRRVDLFIANARPNAVLGRGIAPRSPHRYIPFGVSRAFGRARGEDQDHGEGHDHGEPGGADILGVGNDRARDWATFAAGVQACGTGVRVASKMRVEVGGVDVSRPTASLGELLDAYAGARVVVVSVVENAHASGITTVLEAVAAGAPVVATRTGGLDDYFTDDEVTFVPVGDARALGEAVEESLGDRPAAQDRAARAKARLDADQYWNDAYWRRVAVAVASLIGGVQETARPAGTLRLARRR